jgi:Mrp family chromosome partitioning ATPase
MSSEAVKRLSLYQESVDGHDAACKGRMEDLDAAAATEFQRLVSRVYLRSSGDAPQVTVFTGLEKESGCTWTCVHLGWLLASQQDGPVCIVDADLNSGSISDVFDLPAGPGFTDLLRSATVTVKSLAIPVGRNLWVLGTGVALSDREARLFSGDRVRRGLQELRATFSYVIIDASPMGSALDAMALGHSADGVVLVLRANTTRRDAARRLRDELEAANCTVLGAVLNRRTYPIPERLYRWL